MAACLMIMFLAYSAQMMYRPYMSPGDFDIVIKKHEESVFTSAIHARCKMQISHVESRGRKKTRKNLLNFEGKIDQAAVLGVLSGWLFNYNTIEQVMIFASVVVCLMGIMYKANSINGIPGANDGVTAVVMITIIGAIFYYVTVLVTEMVILYNEDSSKAKLLKKSMSSKDKKEKSSRLMINGESQESALINVANDLTMNPLFLNENGKGGGYSPKSPTASLTSTVPVDVVMSYSKPPPQELWTIIQGEFAAMSSQLAASRMESAPPLEKSDEDIKSKKKNQFSPTLSN